MSGKKSAIDDYMDLLFESLENLKDAVTEAFDDGDTITKSMLHDEKVFNEINDMYRTLVKAYDAIYYGQPMKPDEFRAFLSDIIGDDADKFADLYERAYNDGWYPGMFSMLGVIADSVAETLTFVLPEQLRMILEEASKNYLLQNPNSAQYLLDKLGSLMKADDVEFRHILTELGVPNGIVKFIGDALLTTGSYLDHTSHTDFSEALTKNYEDVISEVQQKIKEGRL